MNTGVRRSRRDYTLSFKLEVVDQIEKGELSYKEAMERYGIQGKSTVLNWLRRHGRRDWSKGAYIRSKSSRVKRDSNNSPASEQRIKELETKLAQANQKAQFFEAVVEILQNHFSASIVK